MISGEDQPERWNSIDLWSGLASSHAVIVSTPQVLLDALTHGYLSLSTNISLLVFDEAHHAFLDHPYNRIMQAFYRKCAPDSKPAVLGLTASPIFGAKVAEQLR